MKRFRQGSQLTVAVTALLLVVGGGAPGVEAQPPVEPQDGTLGESGRTMTELVASAAAYLPRVLVAMIVLALAVLASRIVAAIIGRTLRHWERRDAALALANILVFAVAAVAAISILAGDARAVAGSVGLLGLAASWALQTPIESFTGWLLNAFRGYYRVGDRISVGDVFGDVYSIDVLTTTVWEAGGRGKPVTAAQPTGALITFPNSEVLRSNIINYSRDFPHVWDEVSFAVTNESDLAYASQVIEDAAREVLGPDMADAAAQYDRLLSSHGLAFGVEDVPRVYVSSADAWTVCTLRYLVPVRSRRHWSSRLLVEVGRSLDQPVHATRIRMAYPRTEVRLSRSWEGDAER